MLGWFSQPVEVGNYRVAVQGMMLVPAMTLNIGNAILASHFARLHAQGDMVLLQRIVTQAARTILLVATPMILALILAGEPLIVWFFGSEFSGAYYPFLILIVTQLVVTVFGQVDFLLATTGNERVLNRVLWQTACLNIILNAALIPFYGGIGAAVATSLSLIARAVMLKGHVQRNLGLSPTALGDMRART